MKSLYKSENLQSQAQIYPRIAAELSGQVSDISNWQKGQVLHKVLLDQSHEIAKKLESVGVNHMSNKI